ncbi:MAG TPA: HAD family hydrolase [Polyangiales bacterium]|nr:HAD family hydrolase [Polyangiales bacterium]
MTKLFVSDVDGTLVDRRAQLSARSRKGLHALLERGLPFTVASARSAFSLSVMLAGLPLRLPVIEFNGAFLTELATGKRAFVRAIDRALCDDIYERGHRLGLAPFVSSFDGKRDLLYAGPPANEGMNWYLDERIAFRDPRLERVDDVRVGLRYATVCMTFIAREQTLRPLFEALEAAYPTRLRLNFYENHYSPGWHWLSVHDFLSTKAHALAVLCEQVGVPLSDLTVFGDEQNDIPMFEIAGRAIAVGNAHPALRPLAHEIIADHEQDSVVEYLERNYPTHT